MENNTVDIHEDSGLYLQEYISSKKKKKQAKKKKENKK